MRIVLRATYEELTWPEPGDADYDEGDNYPRTEGGYTDPHNPWGGFKTAVPEGLCGPPFTAWRDENAKTVVFDDDDPGTLDDGDWFFAVDRDARTMDLDDGRWQTFSALEHAAQFIVDFPGGVWDFSEGEGSTNYRTGVETSVTLHVEAEHGAFARRLLAGTFFDVAPLILVFNRAAELQAANDAHLRQLNERISA